MAIKYKAIQRKNPLHREEPAKWYASVVIPKKVTERDIARSVEGRTAFTAADSFGIIEEFLYQLGNELSKGNSVSLGPLGTFRPGIHSEGRENEEDVTAKCVKCAHINFRPSKELQDTIRNFTYEKVKTIENP